MDYLFPLLLLVLALALIWLAANRRRDLGLPTGAVRYQDMQPSDRLRKALYDPVLDLVGRPDYLVEQAGELIPIEVKSGRTPGKPYASHIHQLSAYCMLVESQMGRRPSHGVIRYPEQNFRIEFTAQLEAQTRAIIAEMQAALDHFPLDRSHNHLARCRACGFRAECDQSLDSTTIMKHDD